MLPLFCVTTNGIAYPLNLSPDICRAIQRRAFSTTKYDQTVKYPVMESLKIPQYARTVQVCFTFRKLLSHEILSSDADPSRFFRIRIRI